MATAPARPATRRTARLPNWVFGTGMVILFLLFLGLVTLIFGRVSGEEFTPHGFQRRSFHYYELPIVHLQVWPMKRFDATGDLEAALIKQKLLPPSAATTPKDPRWDLVQGFRGAQLVQQGDAQILMRYLDAHDSASNLLWLEWSNDKPELAKILWPVVARLAEEELYLFLPDVFELAHGATDPDALKKSLDELLAHKFYEFGIVQQKLGHHKAAAELLSSAVKLAPDKSEWKAALEASQKELPPAEKPVEKAS